MLRLSRPARCSAASSLRREIEDAVSKINKFLKPHDFLHAFIPRMVYSTPMAILLGNHSAGKSTLINSLVGIDEQRTGVAPTDDSFTIIQSGDCNLDEDGATAVSNPDNRLNDLKAFGPKFTAHLRVKTRQFPPEAKVPEGMMIVDSPGMIDAPAHSLAYQQAEHRGYDFLGVTKWFAQRADVILLMFDPANPGTTSETLQVLTKSLAGHEHKFLILFNKVDQFDRVIDFARAYGSLCWNLSKVIQTKDIPPIYTTFTPTFRNTAAVAAVPLEELSQAREDVINEVLNCPLKRYDNLLTECEEACLRIHMNCKIANVLHSKFNKFRLSRYGAVGGVAIGVPALVSSTILAFDAAAIVLSILVSFIGIASVSYVATQQVRDFEQRLVKNIDKHFEENYSGNERSDEVIQRWAIVRPKLCKFIDDHGLRDVPTTSNRELKRVMATINDEIPLLRKRVDEFKRASVRVKRVPMEEK